MEPCKSCGTDVPVGDAFCGACGERMPEATPIVPIARPSSDAIPTATISTRPVGGQSAGAGVGGAATVVRMQTQPIKHLDASTSREMTIPAEVVPLRRRKSVMPVEPPIETETRRRPDPLIEEAVARRSDPPTERLRQTAPGSDQPPPVLASDILRQQTTPRAPGEATLRRLTVLLCAMAAPVIIYLGGMHRLSLVSLAFLAGAAILALTPMPYEGRAAALFLTAACAVSVALWQQSLYGVAPDASLLACATILLSGALLFRAYYRGARMARVVVSCGVVALGIWFWSSNGHESLVRVEEQWYSWGPAITHMLFGLLAVLSLTAFMESTTRGGTHVWGYALLVLYAVHVGLLAVRQVLAPAGTTVLPGFSAATIIAGIVGVVVGSVALAQVFVSAYRMANKLR